LTVAATCQTSGVLTGSTSRWRPSLLIPSCVGGKSKAATASEWTTRRTAEDAVSVVVETKG